ncbi:cell division cycle-associated protein 2 isoform X2 [Archocentrus centrarchus]|uniref:cell division cycle-associated protein 2 isoform X2 n=1 Tax=Archocentrus centrarchus TaxID=63155 RepID=UPI0011E9D8BF|nr:cell division cycle-associated protein 2 isoform X2 [Archocentrus centrarchus]
MATVEISTAASEGDHEGRALCPSEEDAPSLETSAPLNFSELTPSQFGISVQSFTPAASASSNRKDKSRLAQLKARRRSSVGVRGSPETNSLIRFMAQQKMKTPPTFQTPELVRNSPFLPRVTSTLRQKMASFRSLMDVEESDACDPVPAQDSNTGGCIKTRDYLSDENSHGGGKENNPPMTPTSSKRRRTAPPESCSVEIREASAPTLYSTLKEQEDDVFELQSLSRPPPDDPAAASLPQRSSPFRIPSLSLLLEMKPTGEDDSNGTPTMMMRKKRVRFGGPLSPEFFDKNLPPSTPLQKGGTPARGQTPGGSSQLRSVLKTPQRSKSKTPEHQLDLSSPTAFGASPTLAMPRKRRMPSEEEDGKIVFPSVEEIGSAVASDTEWVWDAQLLNLNTAFHEESLSQILTESDTNPSTASQMDIPAEPESLPEKEEQPDAGVGGSTAAPSSSRRRKPAPKQELGSKPTARSRSRKRKLPEESEPAKRSTRSAAKSASGKIMMTFSTTRRWNKDVDRSLYSSREYASKNPTLSPITERLSFISQSPAKQQTPSVSCKAQNQEIHLNPEMADDTHMTHDLSVTNASETAVEDSVTSPNVSEKSAAEQDSRLSALRGRGRGLKKRKVSVADSDLLSEEPQDQTRGGREQHCEEQTTTSLELSTGIPSIHEEREVDTVELCAQTSADNPCSDSEHHVSTHAPTSDCPTNTESAQGEAKRGRRSSVTQEQQQNYPKKQQPSHEKQEERQGGQVAGPQESIQSSSDGQEEEGVAHVDLAPWQADFNFEDVFKPVGTRGQRSVRRSLRNQINAENGSSGGLVWLPHTSPDSSIKTCRRTRGRCLSAALPIQPLLPEETQDASS